MLISYWTRLRFAHLGIKWYLADDFILISQYMSGDTRMRVINNFDVVEVDFSNVFLLLTKKWNRYRLSARIEKFKVKDFDGTYGDNNDEDGKAFTLSYAYRMNKKLFFHIEYNWIDSNRPSRAYQDLDSLADESQWQLAARYYW